MNCRHDASVYTVTQLLTARVEKIPHNFMFNRHKSQTLTAAQKMPSPLFSLLSLSKMIIDKASSFQVLAACHYYLLYMQIISMH